MTIKLKRFRLLATSCTSLALTLGLSACAQKHSHIPPGDYISQRSADGVVRQLEAAVELDESNARNPKVGVIAREDFLEQAGKAARAIKELTDGYPVSEAELQDALRIPPANLSPTQKSALISQIGEAEHATDHNEQAMLNEEGWGYSDASAATGRFDQQKQLDNKVIKDLKIGEDVHWDDIQQAMQVVQNPF